jgi:hypothetical protein
VSDFSSIRVDLTGVPATLATALTVKSSGVASFSIGETAVNVQVARDLTIAVGDVCLVQRVGSAWFALQRFYTAASTSPPNNTTPPPPKPAIVYGTLVCPPVETRSYRPGGWRTDNDDVYQGEYFGNGNHTGCAFYGTKPRSLEGATVTRATIRVWRPDAGGANAAQATTMRLVTQSKRPAGAPTLGASTSGPSLRRGQTTTAFVIPTSWAQAMVDGTAGGLGFFDSSGSPYVILAGRGRSASSFALTITWTR